MSLYPGIFPSIPLTFLYGQLPFTTLVYIYMCACADTYVCVCAHACVCVRVCMCMCVHNNMVGLCV